MKKWKPIPGIKWGPGEYKSPILHTTPSPLVVNNNQLTKLQSQFDELKKQINKKPKVVKETKYVLPTYYPSINYLGKTNSQRLSDLYLWSTNLIPSYYTTTKQLILKNYIERLIKQELGKFKSDYEIKDMIRALIARENMSGESTLSVLDKYKLVPKRATRKKKKSKKKPKKKPKKKTTKKSKKKPKKKTKKKPKKKTTKKTKKKPKKT